MEKKPNHKTDREATESLDKQGREEHQRRGAGAVLSAGLVPKNILQAGMRSPNLKSGPLFVTVGNGRMRWWQEHPQT